MEFETTVRDLQDAIGCLPAAALAVTVTALGTGHVELVAGGTPRLGQTGGFNENNRYNTGLRFNARVTIPATVTETGSVKVDHDLGYTKTVKGTTYSNYQSPSSTHEDKRNGVKALARAVSEHKGKVKWSDIIGRLAVMDGTPVADELRPEWFENEFKLPRGTETVLERVLVAASDGDDPRGYLQFAEFLGNHVYASDGFRMHTAEIKRRSKLHWSIPGVVPLKRAAKRKRQETVNLKAYRSKTVNGRSEFYGLAVATDSRQAFFTWVAEPTQSIDYERMIPHFENDELNLDVRVAPEALSQAVKEVTTAVTQRWGLPVKMKPNGAALHVSATGESKEEDDKTITQEVTVKADTGTGVGQQVAVTPRFLRDALAIMDTVQVQVRQEAENVYAPIVINDGKYRAVIMPILTVR